MGAIFIRKNILEGTKKPEVLGNKRVFTLWILGYHGNHEIMQPHNHGSLHICKCGPTQPHVHALTHHFPYGQIGTPIMYAVNEARLSANETI